jgi:hypothetical protein
VILLNVRSVPPSRRNSRRVDGRDDGMPVTTRGVYLQVAKDCLVDESCGRSAGGASLACVARSVAARNPKVLPGRKLRRVARLHNSASVKTQKGRSGGQAVRGGQARPTSQWTNQPTRSHPARHGAPMLQRVPIPA